MQIQGATMTPLLCLFTTLVSILLKHSHVEAQYVQAVANQWIPHPNGVPGQFLAVQMWRETAASPYKRVIDIAPELVVLEYNCYYMRDICKNADNWFATPRGQSRTPRYRFAYDFNTGKTSAFRNDRRRTASCGSFKRTVTCPHSDQNIVMRQDGPWRYKDLEPGTTINEIKADVWPNGSRRPSEVRYTCDEFPPATWIEGGSGSSAPEAAAMDSETRCAAFRCDKTRGVKAEQNWQATAHNTLQSSLKAVINRRNNAATPREFDWYRAKDSIVFFEFRYNIVVNYADGVAARVYTYSTRGQNPPAVEKKISQAKRDLMMLNGSTEVIDHEDLDREAFWRWADEVTTQELLDLGPSFTSEEHILANHTKVGMRMPGMEMPWSDFAETSEDEDDVSHPPLPDIISGPPRADPKKVKRRSTLTFTSGNSSAIDGVSPATPLLRNVSTTDLKAARKIVEDAILKSAKLDAARLAGPARNQYWLKPRTIVGGLPSRGRSLGSRAGETEVEAPPPFLDITDEIAAAAALVSEAEAVGALNGNLTARQTHQSVRAASSGTFWMEHHSHGHSAFW